ncbi:unnamed protein product [Sympodiomycopsis kandeliae]
MAGILQPADGNSPRLSSVTANTDADMPPSPTSIAATCASTPALTPGIPPSSNSNASSEPSTAESTVDSHMATSSVDAPSSVPTSISPADCQPVASGAKRVPKLSDIVAKYGKEANANDGIVPGRPADDSESKPLRGRLGLAGRLNSHSRSSSTTTSDLINNNNEANVENEDPRSTTTTTSSSRASADGRSSPTKRDAARKKKVMPTLQDIQAHLHKKTAASQKDEDEPESKDNDDKTSQSTSAKDNDDKTNQGTSAKDNDDKTNQGTSAKDNDDKTNQGTSAGEKNKTGWDAPAAASQSRWMGPPPSADVAPPLTTSSLSEEDARKVNEAWDHLEAGPSRLGTSSGTAAGASTSATTLDRLGTSPTKSAAAPVFNIMPPPQSTRPLSATRGILNRTIPSGSGTQASPPMAAPASPTLSIGGEESHPLQHKWSMFFDSKSSASAAAPGSAPSSANSTAGFNADGTSEDASQPVAPPKSPRSTRGGGGTASTENYEATLKMIGAYRTVESFMKVFRVISRPSALEKFSNYHLFKDNVKPMWEDPANAKGGKWVISFPQQHTNPALLDRSWMWTVLALIGEELDPNDEVTGAVLSTRPKADRLSLWIRDKSNIEAVNALGQRFVTMLEVRNEPGVNVEFVVNSQGFSRRDATTRQYWSLDNAISSGSGSGSGGSRAGASSGNRFGGALRSGAGTGFSGGQMGRLGAGAGAGGSRAGAATGVQTGSSSRF